MASGRPTLAGGGTCSAQCVDRPDQLIEGSVTLNSPVFPDDRLLRMINLNRNLVICLVCPLAL